MNLSTDAERIVSAIRELNNNLNSQFEEFRRIQLDTLYELKEIRRISELKNKDHIKVLNPDMKLKDVTVVTKNIIDSILPIAPALNSNSLMSAFSSIFELLGNKKIYISLEDLERLRSKMPKSESVTLDALFIPVENTNKSIYELFPCDALSRALTVFHSAKNIDRKKDILINALTNVKLSNDSVVEVEEDLYNEIFYHLSYLVYSRNFASQLMAPIKKKKD